MKRLKLLLGITLVSIMLSSCFVEVNDDYVDNTTTISLNQLLNSYELWYIDINETIGYGEIPFMQMAFTMSFRNGVVYANNNLVGIGSQGNGFGISIGYYDAYGMILDIYHDIDGYTTFDVYQINNNTIEFYNPSTDTSYFLHGYQRYNFDYDFVFYDNIHYFLQEYEAWEKTFVSEYGTINEFDNENYLQFLSGGNDSTFRSSQDTDIMNPNNIYWDFVGIYSIGDVPSNMYLKTLTLNYDYFGNEFFELTVLNDGKIELFHQESGTVYEFTGRGYIPYLRVPDTSNKTKSMDVKKRKQYSPKVENPRENTRS